MLDASPLYGSGTIGTLECWMLPQPLLVPWASPMSALVLWPLHVAVVSDMMLQPARSAIGAPLVRMPWAPLEARARMQYSRGIWPVLAMPVAEMAVILTP